MHFSEQPFGSAGSEPAGIRIFSRITNALVVGQLISSCLSSPPREYAFALEFRRTTDQLYLPWPLWSSLWGSVLAVSVASLSRSGGEGGR